MIGPLARDELAALIAGGEDSYTEFKSPQVRNRDLAKELCALSNSAGGRVLIGVDDDGSIVGSEGWDEERVMNVARTLLDPPIIPGYQRIAWQQDKMIIVASVEQGVEKPYAVGGGEGKRYFIRAGSTSREASREELIRLTQASGAVAGDLRPVIGATVKDLDDNLLAARFAGRRTIQWDALDETQRRDVLINGEILHPETQGPTVAGLLCYGRAPQERLAYAAVSCVSYRGMVIERELLDRVEIGGRIDQQVSDSVAFIERNLRNPSTIAGLTREDAPRPSAESLRELIANSVAHRHYGIASPTQLRVYANRIEVLSPGSLPNGVTPAAMRVGVSVRRNEFLVQHLEALGIVDAVGRGVVLLLEEAARLGLPEPRIETPEGFVVVTLCTSSEPE
ncbi:MAG: putative DNA binding domain-containing protein [Actinomycetota bacterium]|nr:putative DNA binding domain-containing protein [Actinomycetota bacterium]